MIQKVSSTNHQSSKKFLVTNYVCLEIVSKPKIESLETLQVENPLEEKLAFQKQIDENSPETKMWIFSSGVYTKWKNADDESLLWIFGEDGLGKTPLTISLIDDLTNRVERSSQRRALAYCFCQSHTGQRKDANAVIRSFIYQILLQEPDQNYRAFEPWLKLYHEQKGSILRPDRLLDLWYILQMILTEARYEVAYFLLYRPEECGASILDGFPSLIAQSPSSKCRIKWMVVSRMNPDFYNGIQNPQQIDLANSPSEDPNVPDQSDAALTNTSGSVSTSDPSGSGSTQGPLHETPSTPNFSLEPALNISLTASV